MVDAFISPLGFRAICYIMLMLGMVMVPCLNSSIAPSKLLLI
uniref:Uncharacterized protein n=1 Tax=Rhizophora mucronata TaxID=61149 RepID=A0A2P2QMW0_RHIMU